MSLTAGSSPPALDRSHAARVSPAELQQITADAAEAPFHHQVPAVALGGRVIRARALPLRSTFWLAPGSLIIWRQCQVHFAANSLVAPRSANLEGGTPGRHLEICLHPSIHPSTIPFHPHPIPPPSQSHSVLVAGRVPRTRRRTSCWHLSLFFFPRFPSANVYLNRQSPVRSVLLLGQRIRLTATPRARLIRRTAFVSHPPGKRNVRTQLRRAVWCFWSMAPPSAWSCIPQ
jgi:hypothetical protein